MNYPGAEPTRYQMEFFISDPERFRRIALALAEGRGTNPDNSGELNVVN